MKAIYTATAPAAPDEDDQRAHLFVSIDDQRYLEIETPFEVTPERYDEIARAFEPEISRDADGHEHRRGHITTAKRWLKSFSLLTVTFHAPIIVPDEKRNEKFERI